MEPVTAELPRSSRPAPDATRPVPEDGPGGRGAGEHGSGRHATEQVPVVVPRQLGRYELLERVGEGGMGVVWRAADTRHPGRVVAIKVLRPHIAHDEGARERLRREVRTLARVHHPQVAAVIDADVDGPAPYIVTDFVPGPPLDKVVDQEGPLRGEELLRVARGLAKALHAIHEVGIVHRDLKPGNVLLVGEPGAREPIVIDFGTATTFDVVDFNGAYKGGIIAPGINLSLDALVGHTAKLPRIAIARPGQVIGRDTVEAMQSGIFWGYVGLIDSLIARIKAEYGQPLTVVATGGVVSLFEGATTAIDRFDADLTIRGLLEIWRRNTPSRNA